jgi:hypothetical protein
VRDLDAASLKDLFARALSEAATPAQLADLVVLAFQTRNCRGGKGERTLFYHLIAEIAQAERLGVARKWMALKRVTDTVSSLQIYQ